MDIEIFCDNYCPMACRIVQRDGTTEVDCDTNDGYDPSDPQYNPCPFKDVDFGKVKVSEFGEHITIPEALEEQWKKRWHPAPPDLLLTFDEIQAIETAFYDRYSGKGLSPGEVKELHAAEFFEDVCQAQLAHSQPLIEQKVRKEIGERVFQFFASHASSVLFDGEKYHEQSTIETITVFGGKDRKTPCYRYRIEASLLEKFKEAIQSGEPLEGGKG